MSNRLAVLTVLAGVLLWSPPSAASQPEGNAGKLLSNPLVKLFAAGGPEGLPPVVCGGFNWFEPIAAPSSPSDSLTLSLALVPFRAGPTTIRLSDPTNGRRILFLGFVDGLVKGLPYDRDGWNDVQVDLRIATQDYEVTVNGLHAGPFPFDDPGCTSALPCTEVAFLAVTGDFLDEDIAWIDEVTLNREAGGTAETLFVSQFSGCGFFRVAPGGILVSEPPRRLRTRRVGATLAPRGVQDRL